MEKFMVELSKRKPRLKLCIVDACAEEISVADDADQKEQSVRSPRVLILTVADQVVILVGQVHGAFAWLGMSWCVCFHPKHTRRRRHYIVLYGSQCELSGEFVLRVFRLTDTVLQQDETYICETMFVISKTLNTLELKDIEATWTAQIESMVKRQIMMSEVRKRLQQYADLSLTTCSSYRKHRDPSTTHSRWQIN